MTNNDVLRRLRYTFDFDDLKMMAVFAAADSRVTRPQISHWLKRDDDPEFEACSDHQLAIFLNGLINERRGTKASEPPEPEQSLNNNIIFKEAQDRVGSKGGRYPASLGRQRCSHQQA